MSSVFALEYHDVVNEGDPGLSGFPGGAAASYKLDAGTFQRHLDAVSASGRPVLSVGDAPVPHDAILLTFDDGGRSALEVIAPALEQRGWRGHFFVATDCIGTQGFLDARELAELVARGHVVGSHSRTHPLRMSALTPLQLVSEWAGSKEWLERELGVELPVASVPGGALFDTVIKAASDQGIRVLFTSEPVTKVSRVHGCEVVGRFTLRRGDSPAVVRRLCGRAGGLRTRYWLAWNARKVAKRLVGPLYLRVRERLFSP
jgi:peptidoglycan/xylan/chitin deacetylase (PgdA/CDA1 family)